nr:ankyrin repeat domain-containing protein 55-like [Ciona intestinalis]|eukprot:XP_026693804.1 ankyrin repeat domain-containing protein 55-like [Ciona intestinalis]
MLLQANAKVGTVDKAGRSPLTFSVLFKRVNICELFLKAVDFDLNQADALGNTPLHYAALVGNLSICSSILNATLRHSLSINVRNKIGQTPAGLALLKHSTDCYKLFKRTPNVDFVSKTPDVILTRPWMRERQFVDSPDLMRKDAIMDVLEGTRIHRSRPSFNIHQFKRSPDVDFVSKFRRGTALPASRKQRQNKRRAQSSERGKKKMSENKENSLPDTEISFPNGKSWRSLLPDYLDVLREQVTPSYRLAANPVTQSVDEALGYNTQDKTPTPPVEEDSGEETNPINRRKSCMPRIGNAKVRAESYDAFAFQGGLDGKRKQRRDSLKNQDFPQVTRRKTIARISGEGNERINFLKEAQKESKVRNRRLSKAVSRKSISMSSDSSNSSSGSGKIDVKPRVSIAQDSRPDPSEASVQKEPVKTGILSKKKSILARGLDKTLSDISETTEDRVFGMNNQQTAQLKA